MAGLVTLGPYRLIDHLGAGGMGATYVAQRIGRAELSAVKVMHDRGESASSAEALARFAREIRVAQMLIHPGIARLEDSDLARDEPYLATEMVIGVQLGALYEVFRERGEPLPLEVGLHIAARLFAALGYMHRFEIEGRESPVIHRDISAGNVMVGFDGSVKLIDFGLSRFLESSTRITKVGGVGTWDYMPPEAHGKHARAAGAEYDVFAASILAYDILTNGRAELFGDPAARVGPPRENGQLPRADVLVPSLGKDVAAVIARGIALRPEDRWGDCGQLSDAFSAATRSLASQREPLSAMMQALFPRELIRFRLWQSEAQAFHLGLTYDRPEAEQFQSTAVAPSPLESAQGTEIVPRRKGSRELLNVDGVLDALARLDRPEASPPLEIARPEPRAGGTTLASAIIVALAIVVAALILQRFRTGPITEVASPSPTVVAARPSPSPTESLETSPLPTESASPAPSSTPTSRPPPTAHPARSPEPSVAAPRPPELSLLLGKLEKSYADPISDDPSFEQFLAEAKRQTRGLAEPQLTTIQKLIRVLEVEPTVARARQVAEALKAHP